MKDKKTKVQVMWTIKSSGGYLIPFYTSYLKRDAIKSFISNDMFPEKWEDYKKRGYSVVKVEMKEIK